MPFKSAKQLLYLKIHEPEVYQRWKERYGISEELRKALVRLAKKAKKGK